MTKSNSGRATGVRFCTLSLGPKCADLDQTPKKSTLVSLAAYQGCLSLGTGSMKSANISATTTIFSTSGLRKMTKSNPGGEIWVRFCSCGGQSGYASLASVPRLLFITTHIFPVLCGIVFTLNVIIDMCDLSKCRGRIPI